MRKTVEGPRDIHTYIVEILRVVVRILLHFILHLIEVGNRFVVECYFGAVSFSRTLIIYLD